MVPEVSNAITQYFQQIWRIFSVSLPYLGLTIGQLVLGCFVVSFGIRIIKTFFGLPSLQVRGINKRYRRKNNAQNVND